MITIRKAEKNDDLKKLAEHFFYTDPYIFPSMFESVEECKELLSKLIFADSGAFSYKNCFVALKDNKIVGTLLYHTNETNFDYDYSWLSSYNKKCDYTIKHYILKLKTYIEKDEGYIAMLFVEKEYRRHYIATQFFNYIFQNLSRKSYKLHVLKNNTPALNLYKKMGFEIISQVSGYNVKYKKKPEVYEMKLMQLSINFE